MGRPVYPGDGMRLYRWIEGYYRSDLALAVFNKQVSFIHITVCGVKNDALNLSGMHMPYEITWIRENRIVCLRVWGVFSEQELVASSGEMREALSSGTAPVHVVCNASEIIDYPKNIRVVKEGAQLYFSHPYMGWFLFL